MCRDPKAVAGATALQSASREMKALSSPFMHLLHLFDLSLVGRRDSIALEWGGVEFTFGEIEDRSNRVAHALRARGLVRGDRLGVYLANCVELIDIYIAC